MSFLPFPLARHRIVLRFASLLALLVWAPWTQAALRAGAFAQDITPTQFPVIVNGGFNEIIATKANDALHARAIVLDDGKQKIAIVVVDSAARPVAESPFRSRVSTSSRWSVIRLNAGSLGR